MGEDTRADALDVVVGRNLRRVRLDMGLSQSDIVRLARENGLGWTQKTVSTLEAGARSLQLKEALILPAALNVPLAELLHGGGLVAVGGAIVEGKHLPKMLTTPLQIPGLGRGRAIAASREIREAAWNRQLGLLIAEAARHVGVKPPRDRTQQVRAFAFSHAEAEQNAARALRLEPLEASVAGFALWGRSLTEERNARLDQRIQPTDSAARAAAAGHVTRQLIAELEKRIIKGKPRTKARRRGRAQ